MSIPNVAEILKVIIQHFIQTCSANGRRENQKNLFRTFTRYEKWNVPNIWHYSFAQPFHRRVLMKTYLVSEILKIFFLAKIDFFLKNFIKFETFCQKFHQIRNFLSKIDFFFNFFKFGFFVKKLKLQISNFAQKIVNLVIFFLIFG